MKIFVITDTDANGEDRTLLVAARDHEEARQQWQSYYEIEDDDSHGTIPDRIFVTNLSLPSGYSKPFPLGWHNDCMQQVGGQLA
jgi:hypothetical protein